MPKKTKRKKHLRRRVHSAWKSWPYKHITLTSLAIVLFIVLLDTLIVKAFFEFSTGLGYVGAFLAGMFYVSLFTAGPAVVMLLELSGSLNPWLLVVVASFGTVAGDYIILRIFRDDIYGEMRYLSKKMGIRVKVKKKQRNTVNGLLALVGIFVLGSPLPDEVGIAMLGMTQHSKLTILSVAFLANALGIAFIVLVLAGSASL
jgi:hypothetical protein